MSCVPSPCPVPFGVVTAIGITGPTGAPGPTGPSGTGPTGPTGGAGGGNFFFQSTTITGSDLVDWYDLSPGGGAVGKLFVSTIGIQTTLVVQRVTVQWFHLTGNYDTNGAKLTLYYDNAGGTQVVQFPITMPDNTSWFQTYYPQDVDVALDAVSGFDINGFIDEPITLSAGALDGALRVTTYYSVFIEYS